MQLTQVNKILYQGAAGGTAPPHTLQTGGKDGSGNLQAFSVSNTGVLNVAFSGDQTVVGKAAADAAAAGNPVYIGGYGSTATPTAMSADGDMTPLWLTRNGAVNIADGGGSITVDGSVSVTGSVSLPQGSSLTTMNNTSITTTATSLLASNGSRKGFIIQNIDIVSCWIGSTGVAVGGSAGASKGIELPPGGVIGSGQFASFTGALLGIVGSGTCVVAVQEW